MSGDGPPLDPDHDATTGVARAPHDRAAERALLSALFDHPDPAGLAAHVDAGDFYLPVHETIWTTWHKLAATVGSNGTRPDATLLNAALLEHGETESARALADIITTPADAALAEHYAKIVRDHARLRSVLEAATRLRQIVTGGSAGQIDAAMDLAVTTIDEAFQRFGPSSPGTATFADLGWILNGERPVPEPPVYTARTDGTHLFYKGKVNGLFGDPETAKTWIAHTAAIQALADGGAAAIIDADHNGQVTTVTRLLALGARPEQLADPDCFRYYEPEDSETLRAAMEDMVARRPDVVIVDSIGEILPLLGVNSNDPDEVTAAMRAVATRPANAGCCVITIDHLPKNHDARATGFAIGATAKKRAIRGAYLRAEARVPPAPGQVGRVTLRIEKDTTGELRRTSGGGYAGTFTLDSTDPNVTVWSIGREDSPVTDDGRFRPTVLMERVSRYVEEADYAPTARNITDGVKGKAQHVRAAIECLVDEGYLSRIGGARGAIHHSNLNYREADDDAAE